MEKNLCSDRIIILRMISDAPSVMILIVFYHCIKKWRSILVRDYFTGPQTTFIVIIIQVLTRPENCGTCSVGQVISATPPKTHL